jgi:hypothetical protein
MEARTLKRKRGIKAQLHILKALVTECQGLYNNEDAKEGEASSNSSTFRGEDLNIYFFDESKRKVFETVELESKLVLPSHTEYRLVESVKDMPFWADRGTKTKKKKQEQIAHEEKDEASNENEPPSKREDCMLCSRPIKSDDGDVVVTCNDCSRKVHGMCADIHADEGDGMCPHCDAFLDVDISLPSNDGSDTSSSEDGDSKDASTSDIVEHLENLQFDEANENSSSEDLSLDEVFLAARKVNVVPEPTSVNRVSKPTEIVCLSSSDDSSSASSFGSPYKPAGIRNNASSTVDDSDVIDLCSP